MWARRIAPIDELVVAARLSREVGFAWLDARKHDAHDGRYSFLTAWPDEELREPFGAASPLSAFDRVGPPEAIVNLEGPKPAEVPRWIGYVAFDAFWSAPLRGVPRFARTTDPVVLFRRYPAVLAIDHFDQSAWLVGDDAATCKRFQGRLDRLDAPSPTKPKVGPLEIDDPTRHRAAIREALRYIARGDVYEVNLARRWSASYEGSAFGLWAAMRQASQVPLGLFFDAGSHAVLACTMERYLRWHRESGEMVSRPIKGTLRRDAHGADGEATLRADPKERAEHSMIVDLMRNDFGRVAEPGSVRVDSPFKVEPFTGLLHLVSTVRCLTRPDTTVREILEATFPPGSITGAPKIRALEIIEELENHPRGIYCGGVGFVDRDGGLSLAVAIRTATVRAERVHYWAGGGIVEASDPAREVAETELKARVFLDAIASLA